MGLLGYLSPLNLILALYALRMPPPWTVTEMSCHPCDFSRMTRIGGLVIVIFVITL